MADEATPLDMAVVCTTTTDASSTIRSCANPLDHYIANILDLLIIFAFAFLISRFLKPTR